MKECLQFLSRDHFRISFENGEFQLLALTPNPIWIGRDDDNPVELVRGESATINPGDYIALGIGGDTLYATAEDARRRLFWVFRQVDMPSFHDVKDSLCRTPPSPGGPWPRDSNVMPGIPTGADISSHRQRDGNHTLKASSLGGWGTEHPPPAERPSELYSPCPRLLPTKVGPLEGAMVPLTMGERDIGVDSSGTLPQFGGGTSRVVHATELRENLLHHTFGSLA